MREKTVRRKKPRIKFNKQMYKKLGLFSLIIILALFALCGRIIYLNIAEGNKYSIKALNRQSYSSKVIPYKRGDIKDRNGTVLATSVMVYNLVIDPAVILSRDYYLEPTVDALVKYFGVDENTLRTGIAERSESHYWVLLTKLEYSETQEFLKYMDGEFANTKEEKEAVENTQGITLERQYERRYPYNSLACSVLGFADDSNVASFGIEGYYSSELNGINGREYGYVGLDNSMSSVIRDAKNGDVVVSSIDMNIQRIVEKAIKKYMKKYNPQRIAVVIANPNNGEILAMADNLTFDLNDPSGEKVLKKYYTKKEINKMSQEEMSEKLTEIWNNYCVTGAYEPGSTIKPFTVATALEEGLVGKNETFVCDGYENVSVFRIRCHENSGHGTIDVKGSIAGSCNDYMMEMGRRMGANILSQYQNRFGFGITTGIDLPREHSGNVHDSDKMDESTIATNSFGQNIDVNMIQMVAGFSSLVNGGYYYEPRVVKQIETENGEVVKNNSKTLVKQTVTRETSDFIKESLRAVVLEGTGSTASIDGYTVGGKTGTAEKMDETGKRADNEYILSFLGCVPCENPEVVCYTLMDTPEDDPQATAFNTALWKEIMGQVLPYLGVEKTEKIEEKAKQQNLTTEFYSNGIIEGEDGNLVPNEE